MPMYEKGSVRAEPRSKQQERMKKIMKKFLSSLLALTMILSLVIVPANAANTIAGASSVKKNGQITLTAPDVPDNVTVEGKSYDVKKDVAATYTWTSRQPGTATVLANDPTSTANVTGVAAGDATIVCTLTVTYIKVAANNSASSPVEEVTDHTDVSYNKTITVTDPQGDFTNDVTVKVQGNTYTQNMKYIGTELTTADVTLELSNTSRYKGGTFTNTNVVVGSDKKSATVTASATLASDNTTVVNFEKSITVNPIDAKVVVKVNSSGTTSDSPAEVVSNQKVTVSYTYDGNTTAKAAWVSDNGGSFDTEGGVTTFTAPRVTSSTPVVCHITCTVTDGTKKTVGDAYVRVSKDHFEAVANGDDSFTLTPNRKTVTIATPLIKDTNTGKSTSVGVEPGKLNIVSGSDVVAVAGYTVTSKKSGTAKLTATVKYNGIEYTTSEYTITVTDLDKTLSAIDNGDDASYSENDLKDILADVVNAAYKRDNGVSTISASNISTVTLVGSVPTYLEFTEYRGSKTTKDFSDGVTIAAKAGYLGEKQTSFVVSARDTKNNMTHTITLTVPVKGDDSIKDTVAGTSANKEVSFTNDDYAYLYYSYSKPTYEGYFNGSKVDGFEYPVKENKTVTVPASKFNSSKTVTLYVVGVDSKGVASTGTITVSQKSYDINYNVVAGKSVTFNQKDFESFLEDYADDNGDYNSRKDEISFDHAVLTSSVPSTKNEGTLYDGSTEITSSNKSKTKMTDMDKVSFDSVSKPSKGTVTLTFKVYGDLYKNGSSKKTEVKYDVNVVISVVKEDITYTVGIDDTVQLTARDFVNFLQDAKTSYRKSTLDYVKFDVSGKNVSSYAYGGLYRSYSSYSTGKLADSTDKFYYEPSRTQYDLADVAYHTTRWAEAGKTVYIPFTVYGTKNEEASGTMAITIAQTMNFIDVKASDFFYEPVKWAVNNKITNGTSSTTFSPYKNCNRAEIVTFLWRAAGSPEPTVTRNPFTDVNSVRDASYYKAILWASQKGITAGTNATTFSPYQECTRSQIVTFLYRYAGKPSGYYSNPFKDVSSVNEASYYNAILWAVGKGITQGTSTTTFSPYASCTRGEAVTFLYRYVNGVK